MFWVGAFKKPLLFPVVHARVTSPAQIANVLVPTIMWWQIKSGVTLQAS